MIEHFVIDCDDLIQCDWMPLRHQPGPILEWPYNFHHILDNGPFMLCWEEWPVITVFRTMEPLAGEFSWSVCSLKQPKCRVPKCLYIYNREYCDADFGLLKVNDLVSTTRGLYNQYRKHSLLYEGQFQDIQNILKYVLSQLSLLNLVSWPTPYWF